MPIRIIKTPEVRTQDIGLVEPVVTYTVPYEPSERDHQKFLISVTSIVALMRQYFNPLFPGNSNAQNVVGFVPSNKLWFQDYARTSAKSKFKQGPIICQGPFGEIITLKITPDGNHVEFSVSDVKPVRSDAAEFAFEIEIRDYNYFLIYLYVQSLMNPNHKELAKIKHLVESQQASNVSI